jgi:hypothetical protein
MREARFGFNKLDIDIGSNHYNNESNNNANNNNSPDGKVRVGRSIIIIRLNNGESGYKSGVKILVIGILKKDTSRLIVVLGNERIGHIDSGSSHKRWKRLVREGSNIIIRERREGDR